MPTTLLLIPPDFQTFLRPCCSKEEIGLVWPLITNLRGYIEDKKHTKECFLLLRLLLLLPFFALIEFS